VKVILAVLVTVVALCCVGGVALIAVVGYDVHRAPRAKAEIRAFAEVLAEHLEAAEYDAVYDALSAHAHGRYTREALARGLAGRPRPSGHSVEDAFVAVWLTFVTVQLSYPDGRYPSTHTFDLVKEDGGWRVDSDLLYDLATGPRHGGGGGD
jgi:hypothetical protein